MFCRLHHLLIVAVVVGNTVTGQHGRQKRLTNVVCDPGTTEITPPNYYRNNAADWCASAVGQLDDDFYNMDYRLECQRWLGGELPDRVAAAKLEYCYEFTNGTVNYRMGVCCLGAPVGVRCFTGSITEAWYPDAYYSGSTNYKINYESNLTTCESDEVCQNLYTFNGANGHTDSLTMYKGCVKKVDCDAVIASGACAYCQVPVPQCASCCNGSFCNYDYFEYNEMRPSVCPTSPPVFYACNSYPCQHGGTCNNIYNYTSGNYDSFSCQCTFTWSGTVCSVNRSLCISNNPCLNGGTCYDYSDTAPDCYRCDCPAPFIGERCEMQSNLTCSNDFSYQSTYAYYTTTSYGNCTTFVWRANGDPDLYYNPQYMDYVQRVCKVDRSEASVRILFELKTCRRGSSTYKWYNYHSCCINRTQCTFGTNPCLNGGTCYDWSETGEGKYRCECPPLFVGDRCEIPSNLTCNSSNLVYSVDEYVDYSYYTSNCTTRAGRADGKPTGDMVNGHCIYSVTRPSDGHQFVQGVDGQIKSDKVQFEMKYCDYGQQYSRTLNHMCCPTCLSSPCQNGGYCIQLEYNVHVCKCTFGYNGDFCENRLSICAYSGEPHYRTFDVKKFDYQGICKYNLATPCQQESGLPYFQVYARNENRYGITTVSYPWYVEMVFQGTTLRLIKSTSGTAAIPVDAIMNGTSIQVPYTGSDFKLLYSGINVHYVATNGLSVDFDGDWTVSVSVPASYAGKMCGLCGNNDGNANNDLTMANGTYVGQLPDGANLFGDSYVVPDPEQPDSSICVAPPPPPPCDPVPEETRRMCGYINDTTGILSPCITRLPPGVADSYYEDCIMDACYTNGQSICISIKVFIDECKASGVQVSCSVWDTIGCQNNSTAGLCPPGMTYTCAASACQPTCADPNAPASCALPNVDACVCSNQELLYEGRCTTQCPVGCFDPTQQFRPIGDSWPGPDCTTITCISCPNCTYGATTEATSNCLWNEQCNNDDVCVLVPNTGTAPPTTPSPAPDLQPDPYVTMTMNGTLYASYAIDSSCSTALGDEFRRSFKDVVSRANTAITMGQFCTGTGSLQAVAGSIQFAAMGTEARVTFTVIVGLNPSDDLTILAEEMCAWDVSYFVENFNNWRQPIISNIYGCPTVTFNPTRFDLKTSKWSCI